MGPKKETFDIRCMGKPAGRTTTVKHSMKNTCHDTEIKNAMLKVLSLNIANLLYLLACRNINLRYAFIPAKVPYLYDLSERGASVRLDQQRFVFLCRDP